MRQHLRAVSVLALLGSTAAARPAPADRTALTPEDVLAVPALSDPRLAPGGDRVAFVVTRLLPPRQRSREVWIARTVGDDLERVPLDEARAPRWSPDGRTLAVLAPLPGGGSGVHLCVLRDDTCRALPETAGAQDAAFSPDGRSLAFLRPDPEPPPRDPVVVDEDAPRHTRLWTVGASGGTPRRLLDEDLTVWRFGWSGDSRRLAVVWSMDAAGSHVAFLSETEGGREVWTAPVAGGAPRRLTRFTAELEERSLGPVETVRWTNGGAAVEGIVVSPAGAGAIRLPLVVWLHGGPAYHWGLGAHVQSWAQLLAARGYRVLLPNFRGSTGYGQAWLTANVRDWGAGPMADVMTGVDALASRGLADPGRLYLGGGSYGGYLAYWIVGHTDRFRAAYLRAGISDPLSAFPLTDEPSFFTGYMGASAFQDPDVYRRLAPLASVNAVRTPLLIVHGAEDARVPLAQSVLFHAGLRERGIATRLVVYPREGHSILEHDHQLDHMRRVLEWYARW